MSEQEAETVSSGARELAFSRCIVALFKGPINREADARIWDTVLEQRFGIGDYLQRIGLELMVDEVDGYAFVRQREFGEGEEEIPRLVPRYQLSYQVSLLLVLLRKKLLELDANSGEGRLIITREQIIEMLRLFSKSSSNEARQIKSIDRSINKVRELGFIKRLRGDFEAYEVQRILRSFINAEFMNNVDEYLARLEADAGEFDNDTGEGEENV